MKKVFIIVIVVILSIQSSVFAKEMLRFGVFPVFSPKTLIVLFSPIAAQIEMLTGVEVKLVSAPDWESFSRRTLEGDYDLIWTINSLYFKASDEAGYYAIVGGMPELNGVVMVRKDSNICSLRDLSGKKIIAVDQKSYAGYLFFRTAMAELSLYPQRDYIVDFNENIESLPFLVINRQYDAVVFSRQVYAGSSIYDSTNDQFKTIAVSKSIPRFPFAVNRNLDAGACQGNSISNSFHNI